MNFIHNNTDLYAMKESKDMENVLYRGVGYAVVDIDGKMKVCWAEGIWTEISLYKNRDLAIKAKSL